MPDYLGFDYFAAPEGIIPADLDGEDLEQALASYLKADTAINGIVEGKVWPIVPPMRSIPPDLIYRMISGKSHHHIAGYNGVSEARIRITARSYHVSDCARLRQAVRQLDGFIGFFGSVQVLFVEFEDVQDLYDDPIKGSDNGTFKREFDLKFKYRESIPIN